AQVLPIHGCALGDVWQVMRDGDRRHVLPLLCLPEARPAGRTRRRTRTEGRRAGTLHARIHVRLVVVADEDEAVTALERPGERLQADVVRAAVACEHYEGERAVLRQRAAPSQRAVRALDTTYNGSRVLECDV